jgi:hypothetical protein
MSDNIVLEHLRAIRGDMGDMKLDIRDVKQRLTSLEIGVANLASVQASHYASLASRMDRTEDRMDRLERRLELA